jgi:hypothetical protein
MHGLKTETRTEPRSNGGRNRTDQAALMGAALAAIIALAVSPGEWVPFSSVVGVTLLLIIAGYYRPADKLEDMGEWDALQRL